MTSAPRSAINRVADGPARYCVKSTTVTPASNFGGDVVASDMPPPRTPPLETENWIAAPNPSHNSFGLTIAGADFDPCDLNPWHFELDTYLRICKFLDQCGTSPGRFRTVGHRDMGVRNVRQGSHLRILSPSGRERPCQDPGAFRTTCGVGAYSHVGAFQEVGNAGRGSVVGIQEFSTQIHRDVFVSGASGVRRGVRPSKKAAAPQRPRS